MMKIEGKIIFGKFKPIKLKLQGEKEGRIKKDFYDKIKSNTKDQSIENFNLFISKYIPILEAILIDTKRKRKVLFNLQSESIGGESKKPFLEGLIEKFDFGAFNIQKKNIFNILRKRLESEIDILNKFGYKPLFINQNDKSRYGLFLKTCSRLMVGLGSTHVLETSITLHHLFGIPYIPGTALKGVCRMVAFWKLAKEKRLLNNEKALNDFQGKFYGDLCKEDKETLRYQLLFGAQNFKGLLLFLDTYPVIQKDCKPFDLDIMNVHYPEYYSSGENNPKPPVDSQNPNPIFSLTVKKGIEFWFNVLFDGYRFKKLKEECKEYKEILGDIANLKGLVVPLLTDALKEFGIGAKTRLEYGVFE